MNVASRFLIACALAACSDHAVVIPDGGHIDVDSGFDSGRDAQVDNGGLTDNWFATKTTLDVWWQGTPVHDPGRADIEIYTLTHVTGACDDAASETTIKICGITLPPYTSDVSCTAHQLEIASSAWDSPNMPTFTARSITDADAGDMASKVATALVGIDRTDGTEHDAWPMLAASVACEAGTGSNCFPDHDGDSFAGITATLRTDGQTYVGPYDDGLCRRSTLGGRNNAYLFFGVPTAIDIGEFPPSDTTRVRLGMRTHLELTAGNSDCGWERAGSNATLFDVRTIGCEVRASTLYTNDPRRGSMEYSCTPDEAEFVDTYLPQFRALAAGQRPGESLRPLGWTINGRDIDTRVSDGTRSVTVRLNDNDIDAGDDGKPSCAQVRAAFPTL